MYRNYSDLRRSDHYSVRHFSDPPCYNSGNNFGEEFQEEKGNYGEAKSDTIDFVPLEQFTNQSDGANSYTRLQTPSAAQQQLLQTYNAPPYVDQQSAGGFPFIDIGNRYLLAGATYIPDILANMDQKSIASQLSNPASDITKKIVGTANYLTAAICTITQNQPASVCKAAPIPQIEQSLPQATAHGTNGPQIALTEFPHAMILPRRDSFV
jgi:hypothetical protein